MLKQVTKDTFGKLTCNCFSSVIRTYNNNYVTLLVSTSSHHVVGVITNNCYFTCNKRNLGRGFIVNNLLCVISDNNLFLLDH